MKSVSRITLGIAVLVNGLVGHAAYAQTYGIEFDTSADTPLHSAMLDEESVGGGAANLTKPPLPLANANKGSSHAFPLQEVNGKNPEVVHQRFPDGKMQIERTVMLDAKGNYVNHGEYQEWNASGDLIVSGKYSFGKQEGVWIRFVTGRDTKLFEKEPYNKFTPPFQSSAEFKDGQLNGIWTISDKDGKTVSQIQLENGQRNGTAMWYHPTGVVFWQSEYKNGLMDGLFIEKDPTGKVTREVTYTAGRKLERKQDYFHDKKPKFEFEQFGPVQSVKTPDNWTTTSLASYEQRGAEIKHGPYSTYFENGSTRLTTNYRNGVLQGNFESWYKNGQKEATGHYIDGLQDGQWSWWHSNGMRKASATYEKGKIVSQVMAWNDTGRRIEAGSNSTISPSPENAIAAETNSPSNGKSQSEQTSRPVKTVPRRPAAH